MIMRYFGLFLGMGFVLEIWSLFWAMRSWGILLVLGLIVVQFVLGSRLLRRSGAGLSQVLMTGAMMRTQNKGGSWYQTALPIRIPLAGMLLMLPTGFFSSLVALMLLLPFVGGMRSESAQEEKTQSFAGRPMRANPRPSYSKQNGEIVDADFVITQESKTADSANKKQEDWLHNKP